MELSNVSVATNAAASSPTSPPPLSLSPLSSPSTPPSNISNSSGSTGSSANTATNSTAPLIVSPCAACKILRRRCAEKCVLAPYFPPTEPAKFTIAHRVFGASNIIKLLQDLPESQRADAVSSMVYEAGARIRDPVYGCAGAICQLQKQVSDLQAQLAKSQADLLNAQAQQANLMALLCMEVANYPPTAPPQPFQLLDNSFVTSPQHDETFHFPGNASGSLTFLDEAGLTSGGAFCEQLWT
ncbi:hypothetical protein MLD38_017302 [Melastoma candidum]|uniref:Uncharacterized protein n=1 Tax=Melastoma candidum TaxID=119954 RepID=A0ACB9QQ43_9MYRT|nr:hypothetical protein MLD38_017302 [Melastoma candidum]